jgi:tRNA dimethylallyltransferase
MADVQDCTLIVITGPTGSGKSALAIKIAQELGCDIISADSRQIYRHIPIGTAAPTPEQLAAVKHYFVGSLELEDYYSAAKFEEDVLELLPRLWSSNKYAVMCGGSMMYVDAVCYGIDELPLISPRVREEAYALFANGGIEALRERLNQLDPAWYDTVDKNNPKRMIHAIEVCMEAGVPYSSLCTGRRRKRPWRIVKMAIDMPRENLFARINDRVAAMIKSGWEKEALEVYHLKHLNSLNTVGFKELFAMMDGVMDRDTALARIAKNTRVYAKKQLTWLKKDNDVIWLPFDNAFDTAMKAIKACELA